MNPNRLAGLTRETLMRNVGALSENVQDLINATSSVVGDRAAEARARAQESLSAVQQVVKEKGARAAKATHGYVRENPWNAVGVAVGAGILIGVGIAALTLLRRKDD